MRLALTCRLAAPTIFLQVGSEAGTCPVIGQTLSHYRIVEKIGAGGMGEVYRAHDEKLDRDVALKFLPQDFARNAERVARFQREARLLASLNHPHIGGIYGLEESGGNSFLVLELIEGETLGERICSGSLPLEEALTIGLQITQALERAHEKGIIHRDLKPANIKVTPKGTVKLLDFGLGKALAGETATADLSQSPTISEIATHSGVLLGTAPYMSPEQARGKPVDKRTDIWSFGCVLYEILTGRQAFSGMTVTDALAAILEREPDWQALPARTPPRIHELLRRCLNKDSSRRLRDIGDARIEIEEALARPLALAPAPGATPPRPAWQRAIPWTLAVVLAMLAGFGLWSLTRPAPAPGSPARLSVTLPENAPLWLASTAPAGQPVLALSPDGSQIAYTALPGDQSQLFLRALDEADAKPIPGTEGASNPFFSPDGQWVGFFARGRLKKVSLSGGEPVTLCPAPVPYGGSWGPDGTVYFSVDGVASLLQVPAGGGPARDVPASKSGGGHRWPQVLPGGKSVLFTSREGTTVLSLETGQRRRLVEVPFARYSPTGHLLYAESDRLVAAPFDLESLEFTGPPVSILEGVRTEVTGAAQFAVSGQFLAYVPGGATRESTTFVWVNRQGLVEPVGLDLANYETFKLSPDGEQLAVTINEGDNSDIWIYDLQRGTLTRLTFEGKNSFPLWTPDGTRVAFTSKRERRHGLFWKPADGSGGEEVLLERDKPIWPYSWSPDGTRLAFAESHADTRSDIWLLDPDRPGEPEAFLRTRFVEWGPAFSPDGRWMAYTANETDSGYEVYVRPFPGPGGKLQISTSGGEEPVWSPDGREIFYRSGDKWMGVAITMEPELTAGRPRLLFEGRFENIMGLSYDISPNGQRFLLLQSTEQQSTSTELGVVLNWVSDLRRRARQ